MSSKLVGYDFQSDRAAFEKIFSVEHLAEGSSSDFLSDEEPVPNDVFFFHLLLLATGWNLLFLLE